MNPIAACAAAVLESHPHPALRLAELLAPVADRVDRTLTSGRLRSALDEHPDRFKLLDPWRGPWRSDPSGGGAPDDPERQRDPLGDVWVVLLTEPTAPPAGAKAPAATLRESVRWLARTVDPRSGVDVSRWYAIALTERATRQAVARRAA